MPDKDIRPDSFSHNLFSAFSFKVGRSLSRNLCRGPANSK